MEIFEILERFLAFITAIVMIYYISNRNSKMHPLITLVSICTFFLCIVFTKINVSIGIGFGLFAIFSILRFRTETFTIHVTIFIFVSITLSILDALLPLEISLTLVIINAVIILLYTIINFFDKKEYFTEKKSVDIITSTEEFLNKNENEKRNYIKEKTHFSQFSYQIRSIDIKEDKVIIKVFY